MPRQNNINNGIYSDEWFTDIPTVVKVLKLFPCPKGATVMCPFDSDNSKFVYALRHLGHNVICNITDFLEKDYEFDCIYTNPPFSIKDQVIERCVASGKPCTLIMPMDCLGGVRRHSIYKNTKTKFFIPTRRISFYDSDGNKRVGAPHHSVFMQLNADENKVIFEYELN